MQVRNPRTGQLDYTLQVDSPSDIAAKVEAQRADQKAWNKKGIDFRKDVIAKWLSAYTEIEEELVEALIIDTGRIKIAHGEVQGIKGLIQAWMYMAPDMLVDQPERPSRSDAKVNIRQQRVPYPVVGVISPWNFPLLLAMLDSLPALMAGCSVILKASEVTPRFLDPLEKSIQAVPELNKVFKIARGGAETGKAIVDNVDVICFTGSVATGRIIGRHCAERFIPAFLELGGKDPAIVLKDADLEVAADAVIRSCAGAAGQACQSLERVYVHESIHDAFIRILKSKLSKIVLTDKDITEGEIGPLIFGKQADKIAEHIQDAIDNGATLEHGGIPFQSDEGGMYCTPTLLTNVDHNMKVMTDETFGPVIPVMTFTTDEEAIDMANFGEFGLSGAVYSKDVDYACQIASEIEAGAISINDGSLTNKIFDAEKNAFKMSGIGGSRMGAAGLLRFFRKKAFLIQTAHPQTIFEMGEGA